ncbi:MAG: hypothetical protein MUF34_38430 [Polyangiaceae bacterium]|nr:hypothetical protein [Polyangiaceae bacterium]
MVVRAVVRGQHVFGQLELAVSGQGVEEEHLARARAVAKLAAGAELGAKDGLDVW